MIGIHEGFKLVAYNEYVVLLLVGQSDGHVLSGFSNFSGADSLTLATHMPLLSLLGSREKFHDIFDIDEWPGEIIAVADGLEPRGFSWETYHTM